ncbi:MAG: flagellar hook basal-body protein [Planctomycetes bacterium]|nr:flagellar hook basal-body protein [Planctomycetota bacterium]
MIRGLYAAASGLNAMQVQQYVTSRNLAEANKPGYLRRIAVFEPAFGDEALLGTRPSVHTDFVAGPPEHTGNPFDVMIDGQPDEQNRSFFILEGANGPVYTRSGVFTIDEDGLLKNYNGMPVQGNIVGDPDTTQAINIPDGTRSVEIRDDGVVVADGIEIAQLRIATFDEDDLDELERVGTAMFQAPGRIEPEYNVAEVRQGYRAQPNTSIPLELIDMVSGLRTFEAAQRALRALDDSIALNTRPEQR